MAQISLVYVFYDIYFLDHPLSTCEKAVLWIYAVLYFVWFLFYLYLVIYFFKMGDNICRNTLEYPRDQLIRARIISFLVSLIFLLGSIKFFIINGVKFILMVKEGTHLSTVFYDWFNYFFEFFEMLTPMVSGFFLIYMVYRLGFIGDDEEEEVDEFEEAEGLASSNGDYQLQISPDPSEKPHTLTGAAADADNLGHISKNNSRS